MHQKHKKVLPRWWLGAGVVDGHEETSCPGILARGERRKHRHRVKPQHGRSAGAAAQTSPGRRDPLYPSLNKTIPPKPSRCRWKGRRVPAELGSWAAALQGSFPTSVINQERHFDTSRSLLCSHLPKPQAETPRRLPASARAHGRAHVRLLAAAAARQRSPLNHAQPQLKGRLKGGSYKNPSFRLEKLLHSSLRGPQAPAPTTLRGGKVHAGFLHKCTQV